MKLLVNVRELLDAAHPVIGRAMAYYIFFFLCQPHAKVIFYCSKVEDSLFRSAQIRCLCERCQSFNRFKIWRIVRLGQFAPGV